MLYETSFVPCVNKFITPKKKKSYDIARCREVFFSQTPQCFNCSFLSKFVYFFVACEIICLYCRLLELPTHSLHLTWDMIMTINAIIAYFWHLRLATKFQLVVYKYRISSNNSRRRFFFHTKREQLFEPRRLFEGDDYFKYCSLEFVLYIFCFIIKPIH